MLVPNDGELAGLIALLGPLGANVTVRAYTNDYDPDSDSVFASFDECDFSGYAPLTTGGWTAPAIDAFGTAFSVSPPQTWVVASGGVGNLVRGLYATVFLGGVHRVIAAEKFDVAVPMSVIGTPLSRQITYVGKRAA